MPRQKGLPKTGGRQKGTPNKTTGKMKEILSDLAMKNLSVLHSDFEQLQPYERIKLTIEIAKIVLPKDISVEEKHPVSAVVKQFFSILGVESSEDKE